MLSPAVILQALMLLRELNDLVSIKEALDTEAGVVKYRDAVKSLATKLADLTDTQVDDAAVEKLAKLVSVPEFAPFAAAGFKYGKAVAKLDL
jgi:hypothetical protein